MFEIILFILAIIIGIYLISKKLDTEKNEKFEDRDN
tara:strand:- start:35352 stop:35459 length:108 start_codon:yes stop_codon:yes gene_type:complete